MAPSTRTRSHHWQWEEEYETTVDFIAFEDLPLDREKSNLMSLIRCRRAFLRQSGHISIAMKIPPIGWHGNSIKKLNRLSMDESHVSENGLGI